MKVLLIPDSFKDSISSKEIIEALSAGLKKADPSIEIHSIVASDGGEGFLDMVERHTNSKPIYHDTLDPIGRPVEAFYLLDKSENCAFVELAQASGYECLTRAERNPMNTTTVGTGLQILHAINRGVKKIFVGLGGSSTNDAGIGMASVLGYSFLDGLNDTILPIGKNLLEIETIAGHFNFPQVEIIAINDVDNPLFGEYGAAYIYGPQKGAGKDEVIHLDKGLRHLNELVVKHMRLDHSETPGSGAAGGSGYGLKVFCNAEFISGVDFLFELSSFDDILATHRFDLIITGEGCLDEQSTRGKLINGIIKRSLPFPVKVMAICGKLDLDEFEWRAMGLHYATAIAEGVSKEESIANASLYVEQIAYKLLDKI